MALFRRNLRSYARRGMFEKGDNFFQLISTLFCEVKRGFVDTSNIVPLK
jgi:pentatricopeptide repeat protein